MMQFFHWQSLFTEFTGLKILIFGRIRMYLKSLSVVDGDNLQEKFKHT